MLKEIGDSRAEGHPTVETKHGPIALLVARAAAVSIAVPGVVIERALSNALEAKVSDFAIEWCCPSGPDRALLGDPKNVP